MNESADAGAPRLGPSLRRRAAVPRPGLPPPVRRPGTIETIPEMWEETARLEPGQRSPWPDARLRGGGVADLSTVPGPEAREPRRRVSDRARRGLGRGREPGEPGLAFRLDFDAALFRWLISWQPYGGAEAMPLAGSYALGIEPWITRARPGAAVEAGEAIELAAGRLRSNDAHRDHPRPVTPSEGGRMSSCVVTGAALGMGQGDLRARARATGWTSSASTGTRRRSRARPRSSSASGSCRCAPTSATGTLTSGLPTSPRRARPLAGAGSTTRASTSRAARTR